MGGDGGVGEAGVDMMMGFVGFEGMDGGAGFGFTSAGFAVICEAAKAGGGTGAGVTGRLFGVDCTMSA